MKLKSKPILVFSILLFISVFSGCEILEKKGDETTRSDGSCSGTNSSLTINNTIEPLLKCDTYSYAGSYRQRFGFKSSSKSFIIALVNFNGSGTYVSNGSTTYSQGYLYENCLESDETYFCEDSYENSKTWFISSGQIEITAASDNSFSGSYTFIVSDDDSNTKNVTGSFSDLSSSGNWQY